MTLAVGTRLGPYEVLAPLGAGGMGEVYRARDSKLNRDVALKILPEVFALDPDRLARFKREAQVLASLNHPNIAAIYGLEDSELVQALVLELVEGPTLADRIGQGAIPMQEALSIARQIAEALETAREQGVVHRDLKPANIKLRPDGMVKVLDFGLAKLAQPADSRLQTSDLSESPTVTSPAATRVGMIMGTAAYMSPEQARGMPVDNRTDIWAFGCVLYEMLGGQAAFAAETMSDTIARILEREPDWRVLPASTPATIRHLLGRCLQKDQHRRLHDIADARIEIEEARTAASGRRWRVGLPIVAVGVALVMTLLAGAWWYPRQPISAAPHAPVSVLIADFRNDTNDPIFDRTLEPLLRLVLEGAGFITAYDRTGVRALGGPAVETLDERTAQEIAVKQGVGVVVSGSLNRDGNSYWISVKATQPVTGNVIASATNRASGKDGVLAAATNLATAVRTALGDETSDSTSQIFAMDTLSATNLEVVRQYAVATEAMSRATFEEALQGFSKSVELDPGFGMGYQGMALASRNLDRQEDAEKYIKEALRHLDRMTERERFRARGFFYRVTGDYQACVKEYGDLIARYAADVAARNQIALCSTFLRDMPRAVDEMQRVVKIVPRSTIFRNNLAVYLAYSGNYEAAEQEARAIESPSVTSLIALAFGQLGQGRVPQAIETYQKLQTIGAQGASRAISGLGDVAMYEGRFAEAVRILDQGAAADAAAKEPDRAAAKFAALAYAQLLRRQNTGAIAASKSALQSSQIVKIRFLAGRTLAEAGDISGAQTVAASLASELQAEPQALAKIIEGLIALKRGEAQQAIKLLNEANGLVDTWIGHFDLGRAYLEVGQYIQADSEFDRSLKRRGEALSLFLDEHPTYGYFPAVYYYQGRVRESMNSAGFAASYREYLNIRGNSSDDPLLPEVRRRVSP